MPELNDTCGDLNTRSRVLIVDDDPHLVLASRLRLSEGGFDTLTAGDGEEALERVQETRVDAVLLDVRMPKQDGLEVLQALKSDPVTRDIPVVMVSASVADQDRALDAGAQCFLRKPYDGKRLLDTLRAFVRA